jgi:pimeloyl-ACP methyl ester carboxylesterase
MKSLLSSRQTLTPILKHVGNMSPGGGGVVGAVGLRPGGGGGALRPYTSTSNLEFIKGNPQTDLQLSYVSYERGNDASSKSPILLHHSLFGRKENWTKTGKALTHLTKRDVIIPDARNHGNSPSSHEMTSKQMSGDIVRLLGTLAVHQTSIIGHGIGGRIGMYTALTRPDLVDKLVCVASSPINSETVFRKWDEAMQACYVIQTLASSYKAHTKELQTSMEFKMEAEQALKLVIPHQAERALFISNLGQVNHLAILANPDLAKFPCMDSFCFKKPALFICGDNDVAWHSDKEVRSIKQLFPNSFFVKMAGAGKCLHLDKPEEFLEALVTFLETDFD